MEILSEKEKAIALLQKYKAGLCTPDETERIKQWYNSFSDLLDTQDPENIQLAADEAARQALLKLFGENENKDPAIKKTARFYTLLRIAACLVMGCTFYFFDR